MSLAILKTVAYRAFYARRDRMVWHVARTLHGVNAVAFDYRWHGLQRFVTRIWPKTYSHEAPPWAMR